jgi:hypothetical protein
VHHLHRAARKTKSHRPERALASPIHQIVHFRDNILYVAFRVLQSIKKKSGGGIHFQVFVGRQIHPPRQTRGSSQNSHSASLIVLAPTREEIGPINRISNIKCNNPDEQGANITENGGVCRATR